MPKSSVLFYLGSTLHGGGANKFPEYANSDFISKFYADTFNNPNRKFLKSAPSELFTLHPMLITR